MRNAQYQNSTGFLLLAVPQARILPLAWLTDTRPCLHTSTAAQVAADEAVTSLKGEVDVMRGGYEQYRQVRECEGLAAAGGLVAVAFGHYATMATLAVVRYRSKARWPLCCAAHAMFWLAYLSALLMIICVQRT